MRVTAAAGMRARVRLPVRACAIMPKAERIVSAFANQPTPETFATLCGAADEFLQDGQFVAAETCFRALCRLDPNDAGMRERLAASLRGKGDFQEAANELHAAIADAPTDEDRGWLYLDLGSLLEDLNPVPGTGAEWAHGGADVDEASLAVQVGKTIEWSRGDDGDDGDGGESSSSFAVSLSEAAERLTAGECYRRATVLHPTLGEAYKRLADWHVMFPSGAIRAVHPFAQAAELLPHDICAATHSFYGAPAPRKVPALPLPTSALPPGTAPTLEQIVIDDWSEAEAAEAAVAAVEGGAGKAAGAANAEWIARAAASFEEHGCVVLPSFLTSKAASTLAQAIRSADSDELLPDFGIETRAATFRTHKALPVGGMARSALDETLRRLWPLLAALLQTEAPLSAPLLGCGYMRVSPGASAQGLHKDVHGFDRHGAVAAAAGPGGEAAAGAGSVALPPGGGSRALSIQLQLTDTTRAERAALGSLEILPGEDCH